MDPDDDAVLACAVAAQAEVIVSGTVISRPGVIRGIPSSRRHNWWLASCPELANRAEQWLQPDAFQRPLSARFQARLSRSVMPMKLSDIEEEVVFLKAIKEIIDSMVNFAMLTLHGSDPDASVLFETSIHQRFFNIILVDFLSRTDKKAPVK